MHYLWKFSNQLLWYKGKLFNCFILLLYLFSRGQHVNDNLAFQPFCKKKLLLRGVSLLSIQHFKCILSPISLSKHTHTHTPHISCTHTQYQCSTPLQVTYWLVQKSSHVIPQQEPGFIPCVSNFRALETTTHKEQVTRFSSPFLRLSFTLDGSRIYLIRSKSGSVVLMCCNTQGLLNASFLLCAH